jgi:hypothetical protein
MAPAVSFLGIDERPNDSFRFLSLNARQKNPVHVTCFSEINVLKRVQPKITSGL